MVPMCWSWEHAGQGRGLSSPGQGRGLFTPGQGRGLSTPESPLPSLWNLDHTLPSIIFAVISFLLKVVYFSGFLRCVHGYVHIHAPPPPKNLEFQRTAWARGSEQIGIQQAGRLRIPYGRKWTRRRQGLLAHSVPGG